MYELKITCPLPTNGEHTRLHMCKDQVASMQSHSFLYALGCMKVTGNTLSSGRAVKGRCMKGQGEPIGSLCLTSADKSSDFNNPVVLSSPDPSALPWWHRGGICWKEKENKPCSGVLQMKQ